MGLGGCNEMHAARQLLGLLSLGMASAAVQMPAWFSDNMVLQTNAEYGARAFLSGQAAPGEVVQVNVTGGMSHFGGSYTAVASDAGSWTLLLNPSSSTSPCDIYVQGETDATPIVARGVHFGDVFFCSGQSNMVFPLSLAYNVSEEMASLKQFPNFRFFMTGRSFASSPEFDFPSNSSCDANSPTNCNRWLTAAEALQTSAQKNFLETFSA